MKRTIFTGVLAVTAGLSGLMAQPAKGPTVKSPAEQQAVMAVQNALDPDSQIKAAEDLVTKFADTDFKEFAWSIEARAYQQKRDAVNAQVYGERVLAINPKSYLMEMLVAEIIVQNTKEHDLDRAEKVTKSTKFFNEAIESCKAAAKPNPQIPDADWANAQKYTVAEAHNGLGMIAQNDKKWDEAIKEYRLATEGDPDQDAYATRLAAVLANAGKNDESIALCDKLLAKPNLHPQIKQVVTQIKTNAANAAKK